MKITLYLSRSTNLDNVRIIDIESDHIPEIGSTITLNVKEFILPISHIQYKLKVTSLSYIGYAGFGNDTFKCEIECEIISEKQIN